MSYTPTEEGEHEIDVKYDGTPLPDTPFPVNAERGCDPSKVKIFGDGLEKGIVDEVNTFVVETKNAGTGELVTLPLRISIIKLQMFNKRSLTEGEVSQYD